MLLRCLRNIKTIKMRKIKLTWIQAINFLWTRLRVPFNMVQCTCTMSKMFNSTVKWDHGTFLWWDDRFATINENNKKIFRTKKRECVHGIVCHILCVWIRYFYDARKKDGQCKNKWIHGGGGDTRELNIQP